MKIPRSRKVLAGVGAGVLVLGLGAGAAVAGVGQDDGNDDAPVSEADADRAREAAVAEAGGGTANEVDREDDGDAAWEVDVTREDGTTVDVHLDADFGVVSASEDASDDDADDSDDDDSDDSDDSDGNDADDAPFSAEEADRAAAAAVEEVGAGSTANGVDREDDGDAAWEVEVLREDGSTVDVRLDADFAVVAVEEDAPAG